MARTDFQLTADGDLSLNGNGGLALLDDRQFVMQQLAYRLRSAEPEIFREPLICPSLFELRGHPNNRDTADEGVRRIIHALTVDGLIPAADLLVRAYPVSEHAISWFVFINQGGTETDGFIVDLDFNRGIMVRGVRE